MKLFNQTFAGILFISIISCTVNSENETPIKNAFPWAYKMLGLKRWYRKKSEFHKTKCESSVSFNDKHKSLTHTFTLNDLEIDVDVPESVLIEDPFISFGIGLVCYRNLLRQMIVLFSILSLISIPIIYIYHDNPDMTSHQSYLS